MTDPIFEMVGLRHLAEEFQTAAADAPVTVKQIAEEIGVSGSQVSRYLLKHRITPVGKMPSVRGKRASVYPADTVARLRALGVA